MITASRNPEEPAQTQAFPLEASSARNKRFLRYKNQNHQPCKLDAKFTEGKPLFKQQLKRGFEA